MLLNTLEYMCYKVKEISVFYYQRMLETTVVSELIVGVNSISQKHYELAIISILWYRYKILTY